MADKKQDQYDEMAKGIYFPSYALDAGDIRDIREDIAAFGRQCAQEARAEAFREAAGMLDGEELLTPGSIRLRWANKMRARAASGTKTGEREG